MAQRINVVLVDDIDGSEADETVTFALDGTTYEIDLTKHNAQKLRRAVSGYAEKARTVTRARKKALATGPASTVVRKWAKENGVEVGPTGRIPKAVVKAYEDANA